MAGVRSGGASFQYASTNRKLAPVGKVDYHHPLWGSSKFSMFRFRPVAKGPFCCSTYASIAATCSSDCPFKMDDQGNPGGCFIDAEPFTRKAMAGLDAGAVGRDPLEVIREEACAHRPGLHQDAGRHPAGRGARWPGSAHPRGRGRAQRRRPRSCSRAQLRAGSRAVVAVWTYTHTWRDIPAAAFWPISVLASCETPRPSSELRGAAGTRRPWWWRSSPPESCRSRWRARSSSPARRRRSARPAWSAGSASTRTCAGWARGSPSRCTVDHAEQATRALVPLKVRRAA
jgi:hypothetical protein